MVKESRLKLLSIPEKVDPGLFHYLSANFGEGITTNHRIDYNHLPTYLSYRMMDSLAVRFATVLRSYGCGVEVTELTNYNPSTLAEKRHPISQLYESIMRDSSLYGHRPVMSYPENRFFNDRMVRTPTEPKDETLDKNRLIVTIDDKTAFVITEDNHVNHETDETIHAFRFQKYGLAEDTYAGKEKDQQVMRVTNSIGPSVKIDATDAKVLAEALNLALKNLE